MKPFSPQPKKSLGQNYLTDENICRNIVTAFNIKPEDFIVEIGPGKGAITKYIIEQTKNYVGVELDKNIFTLLKEKFPEINFIRGDFLKLDLYSTLRTPHSALRIIGNIPYNITSEILFKLLDERKFISSAQLMIQEEVAQRIIAKPNTKQYGIPSVQLQAFASVKLLFKVSRNCFYPKPKVSSRVVEIDFTKSMDDKIIDVEFFRKLVRMSFSTRRKILKNSLSGLKMNLDEVDFDFSRRAESLSVEEFIKLSNQLFSMNK